MKTSDKIMAVLFLVIEALIIFCTVQDVKKDKEVIDSPIPVKSDINNRSYICDNLNNT